MIDEVMRALEIGVEVEQLEYVASKRFMRELPRRNVTGSSASEVLRLCWL
jgi:hypothetical protein